MNKRPLLYGCVIAALFALSPVAPVTAQTARIGAHANAAFALSNIRIGNFGRIDASYYRGAQPQGGDYNDLAALGVKTVINLTNKDGQGDEQQRVEQAGMTYLQIPMSTHVSPTPEQITQFLSLVNNAAHQPVFVHCVGGRHRTGVMTAIYRMTEDGWTADQAFREMKQYKFGPAFLHPEFKRFVYRYQPNHEAAAAEVVTATTN